MTLIAHPFPPELKRPGNIQFAIKCLHCNTAIYGIGNCSCGTCGILFEKIAADPEDYQLGTINIQKETFRRKGKKREKPIHPISIFIAR